MTVQEKTSTSSLSIQWMDVPGNETNGHLIGYTVTYRAVKVGGKEVVDDVVKKKSVGTGTHSITLNDLQSFTTYEIRVAGITRRGEGVFSQPIEGGLCKEHRFNPRLKLCQRGTSSHHMLICFALLSLRKT